MRKYFALILLAALLCLSSCASKSTTVSCEDFSCSCPDGWFEYSEQSLGSMQPALFKKHAVQLVKGERTGDFPDHFTDYNYICISARQSDEKNEPSDEFPIEEIRIDGRVWYCSILHLSGVYQTFSMACFDNGVTYQVVGVHDRGQNGFDPRTDSEIRAILRSIRPN